jgi:hypothetical protein
MGMGRLPGGCVVARLWTLALHSAGSLALVRLTEETPPKRMTQTRRSLFLVSEACLYQRRSFLSIVDSMILGTDTHTAMSCVCQPLKPCFLLA